MAKMNYKKLVKFLVNDDDQKEYLAELVEKRNGDLKTYIKRGIFCSADGNLEELSYVMEKLGMTEEDLDMDEISLGLFERGYIIPVWDGYMNIMFYINHSWLRDKSKKYLNIYPITNSKNLKEMKMYGMHNLKQGLKEDRIVVVEGVFDVLRLEQYGIPAVSLMGTKVMPYHKQFLSRFKTVIYIRDEDNAGATAWKRFKDEVPNAIEYRISGSYKDIDKFAQDSTFEFEDWIKPLQTLGKRAA